jgi:hypothetical protein
MEENMNRFHERVKGFIFGVVLTILLAATITATAAAFREQTITVSFPGVRLVINGQEHTPRDGAGNVVEPFIWQGTTYLPVRAVADALGQDVNWDGTTQTVYISSPFAGVPPMLPPVTTPPPNITWLDQKGFQNHEISARVGTWSINSFSQWRSDTDVATDGSTFDRGLLFTMSGAGGNIADSWQRVEFSLNGQYTRFSGTLICAQAMRMGDNGQVAQVRIYGDSRLLYASPGISEGTIPFAFNVDVSGIRTLTIFVDRPDRQVSGTTRVGMVNAFFE